MAVRQSLIQVVLKANDQISTPLKNIERNLGKFGTAFRAVGAIAAGVGLVKLTHEIADAAAAAIKASSEQEQAERKLAIALRNTGQSVEGVLPGLVEYASAMQRATATADEQILSGQALLVTLGKLSGETLKRATKATLDFAAATGTDLDSAFRLIAKAAAGNTAALGRYGIVLDESVPKAERFEAALSLIAERMGGQAAARLDTFQGKLDGVALAFDDVRESIGNLITGSPTLRRLLDEISKSIDKLNANLGNSSAAETFESAIRDAVTVVAGLAKVANTAVTSIVNLGRAIGALREAEKIALRPDLPLLALIGNDNAQAQLAAAAERINAIHTAINESVAANARLNAEIDRIAGAATGGAPESGTTRRTLALFEQIKGNLGSGGPAADLSDSFEAVDAAISTAAPAVADFEAVCRSAADSVSGEDGLVNGFESLPPTITEVNKQVEELGQTIETGFSQAVELTLSVGDNLIDAALGAGVEWDRFFKGLLANFARARFEAAALSAASGGGGGFGGILGLIFGGGFSASASTNFAGTAPVDPYGPTGYKSLPGEPLMVGGGGGDTYHFHGTIIDEASVTRFFTDHPRALGRGIKRATQLRAL